MLLTVPQTAVQPWLGCGFVASGWWLAVCTVANSRTLRQCDGNGMPCVMFCSDLCSVHYLRPSGYGHCTDMRFQKIGSPRDAHASNQMKPETRKAKPKTLGATSPSVSSHRFARDASASRTNSESLVWSDPVAIITVSHIPEAFSPILRQDSQTSASATFTENPPLAALPWQDKRS